MTPAVPSRINETTTRVPPILVVDDLADQRTATAARLSADGYPTLGEHDGDTVLRMVRGQLVRLVVSELYVPCSEGRCVVTCLKQERRRLPQFRVLVYTRHTSERDVAWALDAGCDGMVAKTADPAELLREVRRLDLLQAPHAPGKSDLGVVHGADDGDPAMLRRDGEYRRDASQARERDS
jgi:CheY-like chemotaxis protein